jgi:hemerythrin superfamily protein
MPDSMQKPASQNTVGPNATRQAPATSSGREQTDGFELLVNEHRKLSALLERALLADATGKRQEQWLLIRRQLLSHERAEALELYTALDGYTAARDMVEEHGREEGKLESAVNQVDAADAASEAWLERLRELLACVEAHVRLEENEYFPRARQLLGEEAAQDLHERLVSAQRGVVHTLL